MIIALVAGLGAFFVALLVLGVAMRRRKEAAKRDLERELAEVQRRDIMQLVREEVEELGIDRIPGADDVDIVTRLKVWRRDVAVRGTSPDPARLRFVRDVDDPSPDELHLEIRPDAPPTEAEPAGEPPVPEQEPDRREEPPREERPTGGPTPPDRPATG